MQNQVEESVQSSLISENASDVRQKLDSSSWEFVPFLQTGSLVFLGLLGTLLCTIVFGMYTHKRRLRTPGNTFVLSLTSADFLRGVLLLPFYICRIEGSISGKLFCTCFNFLNLWINLASVLSVLLIAMDRYRAVKDPFHYVKNYSKRRASVSVVCVWILSLLVALPILFGFPEFDYKSCDATVTVMGSIFDPVLIYELTVTLMAFVLPLSSVACFYYRMYRAAKSNIARDDRNSCNSYGSSDVVINMKSPRSSEDSGNNLRRHTYIRDDQNYQQSNRFLKKHRAAVTGLIAVVSLMVCFTPYFLIRMLQQFRMMTIESNFLGYFPTFISTVINQYIYFFRNHSTSIYSKKLAAKFFGRKKSSLYFPSIMRSKIANISDLYRISARKTPSVAASQPKEAGTFRLFFKAGHNLKLKKTFYGQESLQNKDNSHSSMTMKQFFHQDSSSSNSSSDICPTIASFDSDETMHYQALKQKYSEESSSEDKL